MDNQKISYLQMIQNIIARMSESSFKIKGWTIGIMIAIFSFAGGQGDKRCILLTVVPLFVLWCLDTYYLQLERKYREFYNYKLNIIDNQKMFDMNFNNMKIEMKNVSRISFFKCMFSLTEVLFYIICIITSVVVYLI